MTHLISKERNKCNTETDIVCHIGNQICWQRLIADNKEHKWLILFRVIERFLITRRKVKKKNTKKAKKKKKKKQKKNKIKNKTKNQNVIIEWNCQQIINERRFDCQFDYFLHSQQEVAGRKA